MELVKCCEVLVMEEMEGSGVGGLEGWQDSCPPFNEDQWQFLSKVNLLVGGYATIAVAIIGIIANSLAIAVFARKNFKSNFNSLLIGLSTFDLLFLITMITESVRKNFEGHFGDPESLAGRMTSLHHILFPYFLYPLTNILLTARFESKTKGWVLTLLIGTFGFKEKIDFLCC